MTTNGGMKTVNAKLHILIRIYPHPLLSHASSRIPSLACSLTRCCISGCLSLTVTEELFDSPGRANMIPYPPMTKTMTQRSPGAPEDAPATQTFILHVEEGAFTESEIVVMLGENGTGKTTFIRMMAGLLKSDEQVGGAVSVDLCVHKLASMSVIHCEYF